MKTSDARLRAEGAVDGHPLEGGATSDHATTDSAPRRDSGSHDAPLDNELDARDGNLTPEPDASSALGSFCIADGWCWERPLPFGANLNAAWGSAAGDVWAVGDGGVLVHYDGMQWAIRPSGVIADLLSLWGSSATDVWACGSNGTLLHYDGTTWTLASSPTTNTLHAIWGLPGGHVYAVGDADTRLELQGSAWALLPSLFSAGAPNLYGIWASGPSDIWAVGDGLSGTLLHFDGVNWNILNAGGETTEEEFTGVWGSSTSNVWMTAALGGTSIQTWDGGALSSVYPPASAMLSEPVFITGTAADDVWLLGGQETSARWDGTQFLPSTNLTDEAITGAWLLPSPAGEGWAVGTAGFLAHKQTLTGDWTVVSGNPEGQYDYLTSLSVVSDTDVWAAGSLTLTHWDGSTWTDTPAATTTYRQEFYSIWADGPLDAWACAWGDAPSNLQHWNGSAWQTTTHPGPDDLNAVWGSDAGDVWVVAEGFAMHYDGGGWSAVPFATGAGNMMALDGTAQDDVWAVGSVGSIEHWTGSAWGLVPSNVTEDLGAVHAFDRSHVWAAGANSTLLSWTGTSFQPMPAPPLRSDPGGNVAIVSIAGSSSTDAWVAATAGDIFHWNGSNWTKSATVGLELSSIARTTSGALLTAGASGSILGRGR